MKGGGDGGGVSGGGDFVFFFRGASHTSFDSIVAGLKLIL